MRKPLRIYGFIAIVSCSAVSFAQTTALERDKLMQYQSSDGTLRPVETEAHWKLRRSSIVAAMQKVMGPLRAGDRRVDLKVEMIEEEVVDNYVRRLVSFQSERGSRTPAYLCVPNDVLNGQRKAAAVLCLHPTDNTVGHKVVVGLGGRSGRQYAAELASRGYVTISPAYPHLANYWPNLAELKYQSGTMKAVWDNSRCLDLLETLDYVDSSRGYAAIGHSLGGHNAIYSAVFDDRIKAVVTSCGFDSYRHYYDGAERVWYFGKGWCSNRYMPKLSDYRGRLNEIPFDFPELLGALAPRPVFINAPKHDSNFRWKSVDHCVAVARPVYAMMNALDAIHVHHPDSDHNFPIEMRNGAYELIDSVLRP